MKQCRPILLCTTKQTTGTSQHFVLSQSTSRYFFVQQNRQKDTQGIYLALLWTGEKNSSQYFLVLFRTRNQTESNLQYKREKTYFLLRAATHPMSYLGALTLGATPRTIQKRRANQLPFIAGRNQFCQENTVLLRHSLQQCNIHAATLCHATKIPHMTMYWVYDVIRDAQI